MTINYTEKEELVFIGFSKEIRPEDGMTECPKFWDEEYAAKYGRLFATGKPETPQEKAVLENAIGMFGICSCSGPDCFEYAIAGFYKGGDVPEGFKLFRYPASKWAEFTAVGPIPESLQSLTMYVGNEWIPNEGKERGANSMFTLELYTPGDPRSPEYKCGIWIPIEQ